MAVLGNFLRYGMIFIILVAVAGLGIFLGKKLREKSNTEKNLDEE